MDTTYSGKFLNKLTTTKDDKRMVLATTKEHLTQRIYK